MFAGSFNPPTLGHLDIIKTAASMFDGVLVCIMPNPEKKYRLTPEMRLEMLNDCLRDIPNAKAVIGSGLTAVYAKEHNCGALLRGVRNSVDFEFEAQLAEANRRVYGIDTVILPTKAEYGFISSTIVRDVVRHGGDISSLVPCIIEKRIIKSLTNSEGE